MPLDRPVPGSVETRAAPDAAAPTIDGRRLRGVIPYGVESRDLGGWREVIEPGALRAANLDDLVATVDHAGVPIGRHPRTLEIEDTPTELRWSVELPESRSDVREAVERGDLRAGSWRMIVAKDRWVGEVRHVEEISELRDVSVVTSPAYAAAVAEYRSAPEPEPEKEHHVPETIPTGTLRVEDRAHTPKGTPEARIIDAMAGVPRGESRDLTRATAAPVEPDDLRTALIDRFREASVVAASGVPIISTDKAKVIFPMLTGDIDAEFYGELEEITESDPGLDDFEVGVKNIKALVRGSSEAFEDSDPSLLAIVQANINTAMVLRGDRSLVAGSTATEAKGFNGFLNVAGTQTIAVGGALTWDHILKAQAMLIEQNVRGPYAVLLGPRPALALDLLKETTGQYLGRPVGIPPIFNTGWLPVTTGASPTTSAIVYAPRESMIVLRRAVTVEVDRSQEFSSDAVLVRGRYRLGLGVPHPQSIVKLTGVAAPAIS